MRITKYSCLPLLFAALCSVPLPVYANNVSFTGSFAADDQMAIFSFVASSASPLIFTTSNATGGFITSLSLFGPDTMLQASTPLLDQNQNPGAGDAVINTASPPVLITAGDTYWVVLTEFDNSANGATFGSGFHEAGNGNFTDAVNGCGGNAPFCDPNTFVNDLTGNWALNINGVASATQLSTVPEPATFLMLGTVLAGVLAARRLKSAGRQS
jgi:hypothetical protein